jgi:glycosyltransferase involved in cell wall biosynthesis
LLRRELQIGEGADVIAMVGRMHPVKGHRGMLQMLPDIVRSCPAAVLLLVGDGPERAPCEELVTRLSMQDHVRFLGQRTDIPELLAAADLVVMPSQSEGLGLAAIEALAAGKPVVAYGVSGLREVVSDNRDGKLIAAGDQNAFAQAVVTLLKDRRLMESFSKHATVAAERFSLERHIEALVSCYRDIAEEAAAAA